jgi:hypothetical protein
MMELTVEEAAVVSMMILSSSAAVQRFPPVSRTSSEPRQMPPYHKDSQEVPAAHASHSTKRCGAQPLAHADQRYVRTTIRGSTACCGRR